MSDDVGNVLLGGVLIAGGLFLQGVPGGGFIGGTFITFGTGRVASVFLQSRDSQERAIQTRASTVSPLRVIYGETEVGVSLHDSRTDPDDSDFVFRGATICIGGENGGGAASQGIESIERVKFGRSTPLQNFVADPILFSTTLTGSGVVSSFKGNLKYTARRGTDTETHDAELFSRWPVQWPTTSDGRGLATLNLFFDPYDTEIFGSSLPNIAVLVRGVRVYDPRDVTGGPASDGWIWDRSDSGLSLDADDNHPGQNSWLCALDFIASKRYGYGAFYPERDGGDTSLSQIDEASFIAAANISDDSVQDGAAGFQPRFTCNGWISTGNTLQDNLNAILSTCRGEVVFEGGKFRAITRGVQTATTYQLDRTNVHGIVEIQRLGTGEVPNRMIGRYVDAANDYTTNEVEWPLAGDNTLLTEDGGIERVVEIDLPMTTDRIAAQQLIMVMVREQRNDRSVVLHANETALELQVGDVVPYTDEDAGWTAKDFWVVDMRPAEDDTVQLTLREYNATAYTLDAQVVNPPAPGTDIPLIHPIIPGLASPTTNTETGKPTDGGKMDFWRDQIRESKADIGDGSAIAIPTVFDDGLTTLVDPLSGEVDGKFFGSEVDFKDREPALAASEPNLVPVLVEMAHLDVYNAPAGFTIFSAEWTGNGGVTTRGDSKWGTQADADADPETGINAPPTTYGPAASLSINGNSAQLFAYLVGAAADTARSVAFSPSNVINDVQFVTDPATPIQAQLNAFDNAYRTNLNGTVTSNKSGSYSGTVVQKMRKDGGLYVIKATELLSGSLPDVEVNRNFTGVFPDWKSGGTDDSIVELTSLIGPGNIVANFVISPLSWFTRTADYAGMSPNGETLTVLIMLQAA